MIKNINKYNSKITTIIIGFFLNFIIIFRKKIFITPVLYMSGFLGDTMKSILGGGIPGSQQKNKYIESDGHAIDRSVLRKSFGNSRVALTGLTNGYSALAYSTHIGSRSGSFRAATNAGDVLGTVNQAANSLYGTISNQVARPRTTGTFKGIVDSVKTDGSAAYVGNPKYVYDSSNFIRYKNLAAQNKNYNDSSFGGANNSSQQAFRRVRHS